SQARALHQRLERAVLTLMAELRARRIERDGVLRKLRRRGEDERGVGIDETLDEPRGCDAVDVGARARHPSARAQLGEIQGRPLFAARRFRTSGTHGDGLLESPYFGATGSVEEVDVTDALMVLGQPGELVLDARALRRRLLVEALQQL